MVVEKTGDLSSCLRDNLDVSDRPVRIRGISTVLIVVLCVARSGPPLPTVG